MESGFIENNNGKIYYEVNGTGEIIVLVHGFSLDLRIWQRQVEFLSQKYQVVTYDMRGYGKSSDVTREYRHHEDLAKLLEHLKIKTINLIGLSLGGEVALNFTLEYPQFVKKLILADSSLGGYKSTVDWNVHAKELGIEKGKENWLNHQVFETTNKNETVKNELKKVVNDFSGWHWLNSDPKIDLNPRAIERLGEISIPTLIITGENDLDYFQSIANVLNEKISGSAKVLVSNAGHMVNMEKPEEFNEIVLEFLKR